MNDLVAVVGACLCMVGIVVMLIACTRDTIPKRPLYAFGYIGVIGNLLALTSHGPLTSIWFVAFGLMMTGIGLRYCFARRLPVEP